MRMNFTHSSEVGHSQARRWRFFLLCTLTASSSARQLCNVKNKSEEEKSSKRAHNFVPIKMMSRLIFFLFYFAVEKSSSQLTHSTHKYCQNNYHSYDDIYAVIYIFLNKNCLNIHSQEYHEIIITMRGLHLILYVPNCCGFYANIYQKIK